MTITRNAYCASRRRTRVATRRFCLCWLSACLLFASPSMAGLLPGNLWPNPTLETDSNSDGVPDFWHKGGSDPNIESWTTASFVSAAHAFKLNDSSASNYGEWYSDLLPVVSGNNY